VTASGWAGLAEAMERTARQMKPQEVSNTLNAFTKLEAAAAAVTAAGLGRPGGGGGEDGAPEGLAERGKLVGCARRSSVGGGRVVARVAEAPRSRRSERDSQHALRRTQGDTAGLQEAQPHDPIRDPGQ